MYSAIYNIVIILWLLMAFRLWFVLWSDRSTEKEYKIKWTILILVFNIFGAIAYIVTDKTHSPILPIKKS